jgi:hypothetical protein
MAWSNSSEASSSDAAALEAAEDDRDAAASDDDPLRSKSPTSDGMSECSETAEYMNID